MMNREQAERILKEHKQEHIMTFFDELSAKEKKELLDQIEKIDWSCLKLVGESEGNKRGQFSVPPAVEISEIEKNHDAFEKVGLETIKNGEVAAVLLAGGMGTRLGFDLPKGCFDVGEERTLFIFQCLINNLMDVVKQAGCFVPLYIMTSEKNDKITREFLADHDYFGYNPEYIKFFIQDMACAVDFEGKLLLEKKGRIATSPNGNGGWYASMVKTGLDREMKSRGIKWVNVFAVDNVCQRIADPVFIGATIAGGYESSSKVVRKVDSQEKMGLLCMEDGKPSIVEYYEMSNEMAEEKAEDGSLLYKYGVILNYLFSLEKLDKIVNNNMPVHVVKKKIPYIDLNGRQISPQEPNGYKFELLVLDMVHMMNNNLAFEVDRIREFAPIKNLHGVDSVDSAREILKKNGIDL